MFYFMQTPKSKIIWRVVGVCLTYVAPCLSSLKALKVNDGEDEMY